MNQNGNSCGKENMSNTVETTGKDFLKTLTDDLSNSIDYVSQYMPVTPDHVLAIVNHCVQYKLNPCICAWYKDKDDFTYDWKQIGYTEPAIQELLSTEQKEFQTLNNGCILRYVI